MIIDGDLMNYLEISKIINKMIANTKKGVLDLEVSCLKRGLSIDKNNQWCHNITIRVGDIYVSKQN